MKRKYIKKDIAPVTKRVSRCGHVSKLGRYFSCEACTPILEDDAGEYTYHGNLPEQKDTLSLYADYDFQPYESVKDLSNE